MSSLWTPYGEEPVPPAASGGPPGGAEAPGGAPEELDEAQLREMLSHLAATPVEAIVTQFAVELQEVAVLHLGLAAERPESLAQATLAIDTMGAIVDGLGERLAPNAEPLRQAVAQLRLAYGEVSSQPPGPEGAAGA